jgi:hypothetical protein
MKTWTTTLESVAEGHPAAILVDGFVDLASL